MTFTDWLAMAGHFVLMSVIAVGGAISTVPEMHRYLVLDTHWMTENQFASSVTLAQASPGPNVLFVTLMGWNIGLNAGGQWLALMSALLATAATVLPCSIVTVMAARWSHVNRNHPALRAFKSGMAPVAVGLLLSTGWLLTGKHDDPAHQWPLWLVTIGTTFMVLRTRVHIVWLILTGALVGLTGLLPS